MAIQRNNKGPAFDFAGGITASYGDVYKLQAKADEAAKEAANNLGRAGDQMVSFKDNNAPRA